MTNIISHRKFRTVNSYLAQYRAPGNERGFRGFSFPCDADGKLATMPEVAQRSFAYATSPYAGYTYDGIADVSYTVSESAVARCECGARVELHGFTNTCASCQRDYNMSGQLLADRSQWGEETGESVSDILMADTDSDLGGEG